MPLKRIRHPFFFGTIAQQQFRVGAASSVGLAQFVTNPEQRSLTYSLVSGPTGFSVSGSSLNWSGNGVDQQATVQVQATDGVFTSRGAVPVSVSPAAVSSRFEFAEIPEIVFVDQFAEYETMGIYFLDPRNRVQPGDLSHNVFGERINRHVDDGGGEYVPPTGIALETVSGAPLAGLAYESAAGRFYYDGTAQPTRYNDWVVRFRRGDKVSNDFRIRILKPQAVFGFGAAAVNTAKGWNAAVCDPSAGGVWGTEVRGALVRSNYDNVVFITGGEYTAAHTGADFTFHSNPGDERLYILGEPYNKPYWNKADTLGATDHNFFYVKNLKTTNTNIAGISPKKTWLDAGGQPRLYVMNVEQVDFTTSRNGVGVGDYGGTQDSSLIAKAQWFICNYFGRNAGGSSTTHTFYVHGRPNCEFHLNNVKIYGGRQQSQIKTICPTVTIANTYMHAIKVTGAAADGNYPEATASDLVADDVRCSKMVDTAACADTIIYNCHFDAAYRPSGTLPGVDLGGVQDGVIFSQDRHYQIFGGDAPAAPDISYYQYTFNLIPLPTPLLTGTSYGLVNEVAGGSPAYVGYSDPHLNGWPNTGETWANPDFWGDCKFWNGQSDPDAALADPTNPYTWKRFISFSTFRWIDENYISANRHPWLRDDGTIPTGGYVSTFSYGQYQIPVPENWTLRSANFASHNKFIGWDDEDVAHKDPARPWRSDRWTDVEGDKYEEICLNQPLSVPFGPMGELVNGALQDQPPIEERRRPRPVVYVGGNAGPSICNDPAGYVNDPPTWFRISGKE